MPTSTGKCILLGIICIGICDAMGFKARSREASTLLMAGYLAVAGPRMGLYTGAGEVTLNLQMLATAGVHVSWLEYFLQNFAPAWSTACCPLWCCGWSCGPRALLTPASGWKSSTPAGPHEPARKEGPGALRCAGRPDDDGQVARHQHRLDHDGGGLCRFSAGL